MAEDSIPSLRYPFSGDHSVSFGFGAVPDDETIKQRYIQWGLVGHNALDFAMDEGTEIFAADEGKVIQSGDNGDFGNSVTIQHSWGQSLYAHLQETKVNVGDEPKKGDLIGISGKTGFVTAPHLHFAVMPNNPDMNNGYLGFIDPSPYLKKEEEKPKEEVKPVEETNPTPEEPKVEEPKRVEEKPQPPPEETKQPEPQIIEKEVIKEVIKEVPVVNQEEVDKQVQEKLKEKLIENKKKADEKRIQNRKDNLNEILDFVQKKKQITNQDARDLLQVSQSTVTEYLTELVDRGLLKVEKKARATVYSA